MCIAIYKQHEMKIKPIFRYCLYTICETV